MPAQPKASVILCVHNRAEQLAAALESLARSEYGDFEMIVVDDASTDNTVERARDFAASHPELVVRVLESDHNRGVSGARNFGIDRARGKYVFFLDSDCTARRDWLRHMVSTMEESGAAAIAGAVEDTRGNSLASLAFKGTTSIHNTALQRRWLVGNNMGFQREILDRFRFDEALRYGCDEDELAWRLRRAGHLVAFEPRARVTHWHPVDWRGYLQIAWRQGVGSARYWYKRKVYLGRDLWALAALLITLPCSAIWRWGWVAPGVFLVVHLSALLFQETVLKGKSGTEALSVLPLTFAHSVVKLAAVLRTWIGLLSGSESDIRRSRTDYWKRHAQRMSRPPFDQ